MATRKRFHYTFKVLGRYEARLADNEPHVTLSVLAGRDDNVVFCGTLTMSEEEWNVLRDHLTEGSDPEIQVEVQDR